MVTTAKSSIHRGASLSLYLIPVGRSIKALINVCCVPPTRLNQGRGSAFNEHLLFSPTDVSPMSGVGRELIRNN